VIIPPIELEEKIIHFISPPRTMGTQMLQEQGKSNHQSNAETVDKFNKNRLLNAHNQELIE